MTKNISSPLCHRSGHLYSFLWDSMGQRTINTDADFITNAVQTFDFLAQKIQMEITDLQR